MWLHHWDYDFDRAEYVCTPISFGGTPSPDRCYDCGARVSDYDLFRLFGKDAKGVVLSSLLNLIAETSEMGLVLQPFAIRGAA